MARILAIDYGRRRCGIAVSDRMQIIATGLMTVAERDLLSFLTKYFEDEEVEKVIIGLPKDLMNRDTDATEWVLRFVKIFQKEFPEKEIQMVDERFTSKMAKQSILEKGLKKKDRQKKELVDEVSAVILLQSFMEAPH